MDEVAKHFSDKTYKLKNLEYCDEEDAMEIEVINSDNKEEKDNLNPEEEKKSKIIIKF